MSGRLVLAASTYYWRTAPRWLSSPSPRATTAAWWTRREVAHGTACASGAAGVSLTPPRDFQPDGPHGPSCVIDPSTFCWSDGEWNGVRLEGQVLYEMHVGTFTPEGTWAAAARELPELARTRHHGARADAGRRLPRPLRLGLRRRRPLRADPPLRRARTTSAASSTGPTRLGLGVILDVVYNHLGPDGNYLKEFSERLLHRPLRRTSGARPSTSTGRTPDRSASSSRQRRATGSRSSTSTACAWTPPSTIYDASPEHILAAHRSARARARRAAAPSLLVAENEPQDVRLVAAGRGRRLRPGRAVERRLPPRGRGGPDRAQRGVLLATTAARRRSSSRRRSGDILYQGQWYSWQKKRRGTPTFGLPPAAFVTFLQNHDQIANSGRGLPAAPTARAPAATAR